MHDSLRCSLVQCRSLRQSVTDRSAVDWCILKGSVIVALIWTQSTPYHVYFCRYLR